VTERVILTLFQQSYKGFKGKFFRVCCFERDRTALDGFPLYWVGKLTLKKAKILDELSFADREVCQVLASFGEIFNTAELIKNEYSPTGLVGYIGIETCLQPFSQFYSALLLLMPVLISYLILFYQVLISPPSGCRHDVERREAGKVG